MHRHRFRRVAAGVALLLWLSAGVPVDATDHSGGSHTRSTSSGTKSSGGSARAKSTKPTSTASHRVSSHRAKAPVARTSKGRIARSEEAKHRFEVQSGYPHGRPGYVVDHIRPLACGGADVASNMQWQSKAAAAAKDKTERRGC